MTSFATALITIVAAFSVAMTALERRWRDIPRAKRVLAEIRPAFLGAIILCCGFLAGTCEGGFRP